MRINKKRYLKMNIRLSSSMSIGSGENANTDHDILVNALGNPYIPGSAVAGVTRHALQEASLFNDDQDKKVFGYVVINTEAKEANDDNAWESQIITYDVQLKTDDDKKFVVTTRDMVELDKYKTAIDGHKFDMETLEPGTTGVVIIEQNQIDDLGVDPLYEIARVWNSGRIRFGAKTTRGYGAIEVVDAHIAEFDFNDPTQIKEWLSFSTTDENSSKWEPWKDLEEVHNNEVRLVLDLKQVGGISIRKYTTEVSEGNKNAPDYSQMTYRNGNPVIPGTSWAGAFRHSIEEMADNSVTNKWFGTVNNKLKTKAHIYFSESEIFDSKPKEFTRSAINRFTGGSADKSLYTEKTYYGGHTQLTIAVQENGKEDAEVFHNALAATIADLHAGILSLGGETSIGRGLFKVIAVNGGDIDCNAEELYNKILKQLKQEDLA